MQHFNWSNPTEIEKNCLDMKNLKKEQLRIILPNKIIIFANGTESNVFVEEYDIIVKVLESGFKDFCIVHNHPGSVTSPSNNDRIFTKSLIGLCKRNKIKLIDHLIIGEEFNLDERTFLAQHCGYIYEFETDIYSFKNNGLIGD